MLKFLMATLFLGLVSFNTAQANEALNMSTAEDVNVEQGAQVGDFAASLLEDSTMQLEESTMRPRPGRGWFVRWRDADTGQDISGWVPSDRPVCGHGANCNCRGQNYCGEYRRGQRALYWDRGCRAYPRTIVCEAVRR